MDESTEVAKVNLPVLFRSLFFQDANLVCIPSMMKRKSLRLGRPWSIGNPRYLASEVVLRMPVTVVRLCIFP
jgi:hypothetical protein